MTRIDIDDLVDAGEVADLLGLAYRNSVSVYRKRYADFPEPVLERPRCIFWNRVEIEAWARARR